MERLSASVPVRSEFVGVSDMVVDSLLLRPSAEGDTERRADKDDVKLESVSPSDTLRVALGVSLDDLSLVTRDKVTVPVVETDAVALCSLVSIHVRVAVGRSVFVSDLDWVAVCSSVVLKVNHLVIVSESTSPCIAK